MAECKACGEWFGTATPQDLCPTCERALKRLGGYVEPVRHGRWIGLEYDGYADGAPVYDLWECSECGEEVRGDDVPDTHPWCHGCGAKMDGGDADQHGGLIV